MRDIPRAVLILLVALTCLAPAANAATRKATVDINVEALTDETQKMGGGGDLDLVWLLPYEFWLATFSQDSTISDENRTDFLNRLKPYFMVAVVQADISEMGSFRFYESEEVAKNLSLYLQDMSGDRKQLSPIDDLDPDVTLLLRMITPVLEAAMGNMGRNMHFLTFSNEAKGGGRIVDPYERGKLQFVLERRKGNPTTLEIEMPLDSLYVARKCASCNRAMHISWIFCPWDAAKIEE